MRKINWTSSLRWALAAFFVLGSIGNIFAPVTVIEDYQRWGYPSWFRYVTGLLELSAALMLMTSYRSHGAFLGGAIMAAAAGTVVAHGEFSHAFPPLIVLSLCALFLVLAMRSRSL